jgi:hypothetical protein
MGDARFGMGQRDPLDRFAVGIDHADSVVGVNPVDPGRDGSRERVVSVRLIIAPPLRHQRGST